MGTNESGPILPPPADTGANNMATDNRSMRRIIADDPEWSLATVPDLVELALKHIVDNFASECVICIVAGWNAPSLVWNWKIVT